MAKDDASIRLTVAQRQALAALNQFQSKFEQMTKSMAGNTARQTREAAKTNKTLAGWGKNIKNAALSMVGFGSAAGAAYTLVSIIRKELDVIEQTADRMKDRQLDFGQAAMQVGFALPAKDGKLIDMDLGEITKRLEDERDPAMAMRLFRNIHGANADLSLSGKAGIVEELMTKRFDLSEDAMTELGVQVADNHAKALAKGIESSVSAQIGLFEGTKAASKVTRDNLFYKNVAPLGLDLSKFGVNQGESMLLAAGLTSAANDREGTESRTALIKLFSSLEENKARYGIEESGMDLLRSVRDKKTDKHARFQKYMLGVFADGEHEDFRTMTRREASLKLEGRSKMKFYMMDLLRQRSDDPSNLLNVMDVIKNSGQIPLEYKNKDSFQVDMNKTMERSADYFAQKLADITANERVDLYREKKRFESTNANLEMGGISQARQKMRKQELLRLLENSGVNMARFQSNIDYYSGEYGSDEGVISALLGARFEAIADHPDHGWYGKVDGMGGANLWRKEHGLLSRGSVSGMSIDEIKQLKYARSGIPHLMRDYDVRGVSDQQLRVIEAIDELIAEIRAGMNRANKVEVVNVGSFESENAASKLGD